MAGASDGKTRAQWPAEHGGAFAAVGRRGVARVAARAEMDVLTGGAICSDCSCEQAPERENCHATCFRRCNAAVLRPSHPSCGSAGCDRPCIRCRGRRSDGRCNRCCCRRTGGSRCWCPGRCGNRCGYRYGRCDRGASRGNPCYGAGPSGTAARHVLRRKSAWCAENGQSRSSTHRSVLGVRCYRVRRVVQTLANLAKAPAGRA